eukprot:scaffold3928_cov257-Pinguiococcus_pyrenoidosus.AAC.5
MPGVQVRALVILVDVHTLDVDVQLQHFLQLESPKVPHPNPLVVPGCEEVCPARRDARDAAPIQMGETQRNDRQQQQRNTIAPFRMSVQDMRTRMLKSSLAWQCPDAQSAVSRGAEQTRPAFLLSPLLLFLLLVPFADHRYDHVVAVGESRLKTERQCTVLRDRARMPI